MKSRDAESGILSIARYRLDYKRGAFLIAYIVSSFAFNNTGKGGHYYTACTIFEEMARHQDAVLIVIGDLKPDAIDFASERIWFFHVSRALRWIDFRRVRDVVLQLKVTVLHAFDTYSFLFSRIIGQFTNIRIFSTKCGGPRPKLHYYPRICPDIVFSYEDVNYFKKRAQMFSVEPPVLLPNRISRGHAKQLHAGRHELPDIKKDGVIKIIRIARICRTYEKSIFQAIELTRALKARGIRASLYVVGFLEDASVFERVRRNISDSDFFLTEDCYALCASRHLKDVDIVVASGRGVMEACYSKKIICCSVNNSKIPYLMDGSNFNHFFYYNFSSRASRLNSGVDENLEKIITLIQDKKKFKEYNDAMAATRSAHFDISTVISNYMDLYAQERFNKKSAVNIIDLLIHLLVAKAKLMIRRIQNTKNNI